MSGLAATGMAGVTSPLDEHEGEQAADQAVEHDGLGEREAEPHDPLELAAQLRLAGDGLDHRAEDVADADAGAERAEADAERERDRLAGVDARCRPAASTSADRCSCSSLVLGLDRRADVDG